MGSGCVSVGRAVTFDTRGLRFESRPRQNLHWTFFYCHQLYWKDENKEKEVGTLKSLQSIDFRLVRCHNFHNIFWCDVVGANLDWGNWTINFFLFRGSKCKNILTWGVVIHNVLPGKRNFSKAKVIVVVVGCRWYVFNLISSFGRYLLNHWNNNQREWHTF